MRSPAPVLDFRHAAEREHELNARQREVLALVASGLTNGEIGDRLDITLDGAKWNVSEILSKLGLASREEAAAYWRWRNRPAARISRWAKGALPALGWKWLAGGAATAVAAGGVVGGVLLFSGSSGPADDGDRAFELEARILVTDEVDGVTESLLAWQWADHRHNRYTIDQTSDRSPVPVRIEVVTDGAYQWAATSSEPTYRRDAIPPLPDDAPPALPVSIFIGPAPKDSMRELVAFLHGMVDNTDPASFAHVVGSDEMLGVSVEIIEFGPAWRSQSADSDGTDRVTSGGNARVWVDPDTMFVLRYETANGLGQDVRMDVTRVDYRATFDPDDFTFVPPAGKVLDARAPDDVARGEEVLATDVAGNPVWPGYYGIETLPDGYGQVDWTRDGGNPPTFTVGLTTKERRSKVLEENDYVRVRQSPSGYAGAGASGPIETVPLANGNTASLFVAGTMVRLWWDDGDVFVDIEANALSPDDVVAFAGSLRKY